MNISRENLEGWGLRIKIEVAESDYAEQVTKQLKSYRRNAIMPGFRKGNVPMGIISKMYRTGVVCDVVDSLLKESLSKFIDEEKLDLLGMPIANDEKNGSLNFETDKDFVFYFDAALLPHMDIDWSKVDVKRYTIRNNDEDVNAYVESLRSTHGKFETPEVVGEGDHVYGQVKELDANGKVVEGGLSTFASFPLSEVKDAAVVAAFYGKKAEEKVVFNMGKAFDSEKIKQYFRLEQEAADACQCDVEFSISGSSHITPAELNEELFEKVLPGRGIKDESAFRSALAERMNENNEEYCKMCYVRQVREFLTDNGNAVIPADFMKRWLCVNRADEGVTAESVEAEWEGKYLPSLKWECTEYTLNKIKRIEPTKEDIIDFAKDILRKHDDKKADEDEKQYEERLGRVAESIVESKNNFSELYERCFVNNCYKLFMEHLTPEVEEVTLQEFREKSK